jgi:hypothetical protein
LQKDERLKPDYSEKNASGEYAPIAEIPGGFAGVISLSNFVEITRGECPSQPRGFSPR